MKKTLTLLLGLILLLGMFNIAFAVTAPAVYCDGDKVSSRELYEYDLADGTLAITWAKQSDAKRYYCRCIGLQEKPDFEDSYQSNRGTVLAEKDTTSTTTSGRKVSLSTSKIEDYAYLKIAVATYDSSGKAYWLNFGVELTDSRGYASVPEFDDYKAKNVYDFDISKGTNLRIDYYAENADAYYVRAILLNEVPSSDQYQSDRAVGTAYENDSRTSEYVSISPSKMKGAKYLKVAVGAYGTKESPSSAHWAWIGFRLIDSSNTGLELSDSSVSLGYAGGSDTVTVSGVSSYSLSWPTQNETKEGNKWLTVTKSGSTIKLSARANYGASSRSETVTVTSSSGETATINVTQKAGYAAPKASIYIGNDAYNSGATYGPLANGGEDILWLYVKPTNAQRIYVGTNNTTLGHVDHTVSITSTAKQECAFKIPQGLTPGTYTFTIYVSNSDIKEDAWAQSITPMTLKVNVIKASGSLPGTTSQSYNPSEAIKYAGKYALNYNSAYSNYNSIGGDCANFVSQCLIAGGFKMDSNWYWNAYQDYSASWTGAISLRTYLNKTLGYNCVASPALSDLHAGDIIWSDNGGHVMIVTEVGSNYFKYCGHNKDRQNATSNSTSWLTHVVHMPNTTSAPVTPPPATGTYTIPGMGTISYVPGKYFTPDHKACNHTSDNNYANCRSRGIDPNGCFQCFGFANCVETEIYGKLGTKWTDVYVANGSLTAAKIKDIVTRAGVGAHIRTNRPSSTQYGHSLIVTSITDTGFSIIQANGQNNNEYSGWEACRIGTYTYTWQSYVDSTYGKRGIEWVRVHNPNTGASTPTPAPVTASVPVFNGYTALTVTDYNPANGSLTISWSATNAAAYKVRAFLLNERPNSDDDSQGDRAVKTIKDAEQSANSLTLSASDMSGGHYMKFAVGARSSTETTYHWSWIGIKFTGDVVHTWNAGTISVPATCTTYGTKIYTCTGCGETKTEDVPATGHAIGETRITKQPTCSATGMQVTYCANCSVPLSEDTLPATGNHIEGDTEVVLDPTCSSDGLQKTYCADCGTSLSEDVIPATGNHIDGDTEVVLAPTCSSDGLQMTYCAGCGIILSEDVIPATGKHVDGDTEVVLAPTCSTTGVRMIYCASCNMPIAEEVIPATGNHVDGDTAITVAPTCSTTGVRVTYCASCNTPIAEEILPAAGHKPVTDPAVAATCTASGLTEGSHCSVCGATITAQTTIPAVAHKWDAGVITVKPTPTQNGILTYTCSVCSGTKTEAIAASDISFFADGNVYAAAGTPVTFQLAMTNQSHTALGALKFTFSMPKGVTITNVVGKNEMAGALITIGKAGNSITCTSLNGFSNSGVLMDVTLNLPSDLALPADIAVDVTASTLIPVKPLAVPGFSIRLDTPPTPARTPGDANEDGITDMFDALIILQHDAGWGVELNLANSDVNADGIVDMFDALLILQYDAGWDVILL